MKESFALLEPHTEKAAAYFYGRLFAENPRMRSMFPPAMDVQRDRLFHALTTIVGGLDSPETLAPYLGQLGRDHRKYGVFDEHYPAVGSALLATVRRFLGDAWTEEAELAWTSAYGTAAALMTEAAKADAEHSPPWWIAEVVAHERRTPDIAVVTLRPGQDFPYLAGQHLTVQTARWPRVWRPFSIANAPGPDGLLRLHVRAVPGGMVSGALVRHTEVGHSVLLGPPMGGMVLDPGSDRDLLFVAGGTGLAPVKALVEQVVALGQQRHVHLVFGARSERDLYDLDELRGLEEAHPWLRVIPVVSQEGGFPGLRGRVTEVLGRFRDWSDHDVYVSGPPDMIAETAARLLRLGVPPGRIHHDGLDARAPATGCPFDPARAAVRPSPPAPVPAAPLPAAPVPVAPVVTRILPEPTTGRVRRLRRRSA